MVTAYQVVELLILLTFIFFISDIRRKKGMKSLVNERSTLFMKVVYALSAGAYIYVIVIIDRLLYSDIIAFVLTLGGTLLTMKAKLDLAESHTWTGYGVKDRRLVTTGIYRYIRHPLYTGIFVYICGGLAIMVPRIPWFISIIAVAVIAYFFFFLVRSAKLETQLLKDTFGKEFLVYQKQVHPFLPLRKFNINR